MSSVGCPSNSSTTARALVNNPVMILADEPTGNLDSHVGMETMSVLQGLNRLHRVTVMLVTHDPRVAAYCQRRLSLQDGKIVTDGMDRTRHPAAMGSGRDGC